MRRLILPLRFKGARTYVQGPDIFDGLHALLATEQGLVPLRNIDCRFHKLTASNLVVDLRTDPGPATMAEGDLVAVSSCEAGNQRLLCLMSESDQPVVRREAFQEDQIVDACVMRTDRRAIELHDDIPFSRSEVYTAMNKALVRTLFPGAEGKWLLVRLVMEEYVARKDFSSITLELVETFGMRLTKSIARVDGAEHARVYFSLVQPAAFQAAG